MADETVIDDVRDAKRWLDHQAPSFEALAAKLRAVEQAYRGRTGEFAAIPAQRSLEVEQQIESAARAPENGSSRGSGTAELGTHR